MKKTFPVVYFALKSSILSFGGALNMSSNNKSSRIFAGKGYYIALILCVAAIGITGYLYSRNPEETEQTMKLLGTETAPSGTEALTQPATAASEPEPTLKTAAPVAGQTVAEYAVDCLGYNQTTRDWRTHSGMDIAAEAGTQVCAAAAGTVYSVYDDEALGRTVVITHAGGYATRYGSLAQEVAVAPGDAVALGQPIGTVGSTALLESALEPHVHFCVTCNGEPVDPQDFLALGQ